MRGHQHQRQLHRRQAGADPLNIEVTYRPKGCITYVGGTKYDGWTAMVENRARDGTWLDEQGKPLPDGQLRQYRAAEMYGDAEFNELDFGELIEEVDAPGVETLTHDAVMEEIQAGGTVRANVKATFMAPRRNRPTVKIILSNAPSGTARGPFNAKIIYVNNDTPQLEMVLLDHIFNLMADFMEGRASIASFSNDEIVYVELSDAVVDRTMNEEGCDSVFDVLNNLVPTDFLEELAKKLMAIYEVSVSVVTGKPGGLAVRRERREPTA